MADPVAGAKIMTTTDGKVEFTRHGDGSVTVLVKGPDGGRIASRVIPANEWQFIAKIL